MPSNENAPQDDFGVVSVQQSPDSGMKNQAIIFTLLSIIFGIIPSIIGYFVSEEKTWIRRQMTELLNFQITVIIGMIVAIVLNATVILAFIGLPLMVIIGLLDFIFLIVGTVKASKGQFYKYPLTIRLLS